ncbi:MAG: alpha/beta hydrolase, partial [Gammaproteobacteria bacterium]|nr:alpha/beta hydrolase [Gammaproteobacteria bacterium]
MKVAFDQGELNVVIKGQPQTQMCLFILPGGPGLSHTLYQPFCDVFADHYCLIYFDPPGCGDRSRYPKSSYHIDQYIRAVNTIKDHLALEQICLLGISYGAMAGLKYLSQFHQQVRSAILISCAPHHRFIDLAQANLRARATAEQQAVCQQLWAGNFENRAQAQHFFEIMAPLYSKRVAEGKKPAFTETETETEIDINVDVLNNAFKNRFWQLDLLLPQLSTISCPVLALTGEADWITDAKLLDGLAQHLPQRDDICLQVIADCGHSMSLDQPQLAQRMCSDPSIISILLFNHDCHILSFEVSRKSLANSPSHVASQPLTIT